MPSTCTPLGGGVLGARAYHEGTRLASPRSPLALGRRHAAHRCSQGRVLAFKGEQKQKGGGAAKDPAKGAGAGGVEARPPCASVTFKTCRHVGFGQVLKVVGGLPQLGDWDCKQAPAMTWSEGDFWVLTLDLPAGKHEFKVVVDKGNVGTEWEAGGNRTLLVPAFETSAQGAFTIVCEWGNASSLLETPSKGEPQRKGSALSDSEDDVPLLRSEDFTAEPYSPAGDEGEPPVVGKMTVDRGQASNKPQQVTADQNKQAEEQHKGPSASAPPAPAAPAKKGSTAAASAPAPPVTPTTAVKKGAKGGNGGRKGAAGPAPAAGASKVAPGPTASAVGGSKGPAPPAATAASGGSSSSSSSSSAGGAKEAAGPAGGDKHAAVKMEAGDYPSQTPMGQGSDAALGGEPAGGLKPSTEASIKKELQQRAFSRDEGDEDEGGDDDDYGSGGTGSAGKPAGAAQQGQQGQRGQREEPPPPPASAFTLPALPTAREPPSGLQLAASAAGLAALPVVAWSEWVLKSTGCGLPPGPSGLLGAAEGVSYLVVGTIVLWSLARKLGTGQGGGQGLPAGPAGALGAVEGGSWLAALSGLVVLGMQWQTYGYIPSALPDSNCFGATAPAPGYTVAQVPKSGPGGPAAAPALTSNAGSQATTPGYSLGALRLPAGGSTLPQGNLLFSAAEGVLSQSGSIIQTAETAAAAMAAAAAGQPPPAAVAAAVQHLQHKALQMQQVASVLTARVKKGGDASSMHAAAQAAAQVVVQQAAVARANAALAPQPEPLSFQPPRVKVRAALKSSWAALQHNEKLLKLVEPYPLPAVARQAAAQAAVAVDAVEQVAEASLDAVGHEERRVASFGRHALQLGARGLLGAAGGVGDRLLAAMPPQVRAWLPASAQQAQAQAAPAAVAANAADSQGKAAGSAASLSTSKAARATAGASKVAAEATADATAKAAAASTKPLGGSNALSGEMFAGALADLKEGYVELWQSALEFDPRKAVASVQERIQAGKQQAAAAAAKAAAADAQAAAAASSNTVAASNAHPSAVAPATNSKAGVAAAAASSSKAAMTAAPAGSSKAAITATPASSSKTSAAAAAASSKTNASSAAASSSKAGAAAAPASSIKTSAAPAAASASKAIPAPAAASTSKATASKTGAAPPAISKPSTSASDSKVAVISGAASPSAVVPKKAEKPAGVVAAAASSGAEAPAAAGAVPPSGTKVAAISASSSAAVPKKAEKPAPTGGAAAAASGAAVPAAAGVVVPPVGAPGAPSTPPGAA